MSRPRKETLKKRKDGRYRTIYKGIQFYGKTSNEAIMAREAYKELERNGYFDKPLSPPLETFADKWFNQTYKNKAYKTRTKAKTILNKLINEYGCMQINEIKPADIKDIYTNEFAGLNDQYIKSASQIYKKLFDAAIDNKYCTENPARMTSAQPHKGYMGSHRAITDLERKWITEYCQNHKLYPAVMTMLYAGIRPPEAKALNLDKSFDESKMELKIYEFAHQIDDNHYEINETGKNKNAIRTVPVFPPLYKAIKDKHGLLVPTKDNKITTLSGWYSAWRSYVSAMETAINGCSKRWYGRSKEHKAILDAGGSLPPWREFNVVPYDLRHSFCTMCRDNGVEINTCIHWMGHTDASMILKIYDEFNYKRAITEADKLRKNYFKSSE